MKQYYHIYKSQNGQTMEVLGMDEQEETMQSEILGKMGWTFDSVRVVEIELFV
jgi:hypothetical protein